MPEPSSADRVDHSDRAADTLRSAEQTKVEVKRAQPACSMQQREPEIGGPQGPEPTRYGDWERKGRCIDF
jgi:hypothetical protein